MVEWNIAASSSVEGSYGAKRGYVEVKDEGLVFSTVPYGPAPPCRFLFNWGPLLDHGRISSVNFETPKSTIPSSPTPPLRSSLVLGRTSSVTQRHRVQERYGTFHSSLVLSAARGSIGLVV
jgi:hypothetical protein